MRTPTKPESTVSTSGRQPSTVQEPESGLNLAVLLGPCSSDVELRTLESGTRVASLAIRVPSSSDSRRRARNRENHSSGATSVPVTVWNPPAWIEAVEAGDVLVVVGAVRRRFFAMRSGGRGSRADVEATTIARATTRNLERAARCAAGALDVLR